MSEVPKKPVWEIVLIAVCVFVLTGLGIYNVIRNERVDKSLSATFSENDKNKTISVYVGGEVVKPGEYTLKEGCRVGDAIEAAGGFTESANKKINVAVKLKNGGKVIVATGGEDANSGIDFKININKATAEEIMTIEGIGEKTAEAIIDYREKNGSFLKPEDIMSVKGIGEATFEKIKNIIVTE